VYNSIGETKGNVHLRNISPEMLTIIIDKFAQIARLLFYNARVGSILHCHQAVMHQHQAVMTMSLWTHAPLSLRKEPRHSAGRSGLKPWR
jgi:hypothetical protein